MLIYNIREFTDNLKGFHMKLIRKLLIVLTAIFISTNGCNDSDSLVTPVVNDRTPPDISWVSPSAGSTLIDTVKVQLRYQDDMSVDSVSLVKDGAMIAIYHLGKSDGQVEYL